MNTTELINDLLDLKRSHDVSIDLQQDIDAIIRKVVASEPIGACSTCGWFSDMTYEGTETCKACLEANNYKNSRTI